jgi:hypothetical protein
MSLALSLKSQYTPRSAGKDLDTRRTSTTQRSTVSVAPLVPTASNIGTIRYKMVQLLLEHGADPNLMTNFRKSPLHLTSILGAGDVMSLLLPQVTNPNTLSANNKTALHMCVEKGFSGLVSQLIEAKASLTLRDIRGMSALHHAARLGLTHITHLLLRAGADPNCNDFKQRTPLHHACIRCQLRVIYLLERAGASVYKTDVAGFMPHDYDKGGKARVKPNSQAAQSASSQSYQTEEETQSKLQSTLSSQTVQMEETQSKSPSSSSSQSVTTVRIAVPTTTSLQPSTSEHGQPPTPTKRRHGRDMDFYLSKLDKKGGPPVSRSNPTNRMSLSEIEQMENGAVDSFVKLNPKSITNGQ